MLIRTLSQSSHTPRPKIKESAHTHTHTHACVRTHTPFWSWHLMEIGLDVALLITGKWCVVLSSHRSRCPHWHVVCEWVCVAGVHRGVRPWSPHALCIAHCVLARVWMLATAISKVSACIDLCSTSLISVVSHSSCFLTHKANECLTGCATVVRCTCDAK